LEYIYIWTGVIVGILNLIVEWEIRFLVLLSLAAHVVVALVAGIRRREADIFPRFLLWLGYLVPDWAALRALGNLTLGSTAREQQLVVLWVPFLLVHLGGPDNITAYSLEDNKLSKRQVIKTALQVVGTPLAIYKQYMVSPGDGALLWASVGMVVVGAVKYLEKAYALWKVDFDKIRASESKKQQPKSLRVQPPPARWKKRLDDERALLLAHDLLHITMGAFADFPVYQVPLKKNRNLKEIFSVVGNGDGWDNMCKVVEMELSLMYDILYTKAAVTHTWVGYFIRAASLIATATTTLLFWLYYSKDGQRVADVIITYILLLVTLVLDARWLLRAIASTWTYGFLNARPECWLHHRVLCSGRWHRLRHAIMSLDLRRWLRADRRSYRSWSRTIGRYNLLRECTNDTTTSFSKVVKEVVPEDKWMEYEYSKDLDLDISEKVRALLFEQIGNELEFWVSSEEEKKKEEEEKKKKMSAPMPESAPVHERHRTHRLLDESMDFLPELEELILIWHLATDIFLWDNHEELNRWQEQVATIRAVSDYMVFLVAVRPDMIPGLKIRSLYDGARKDLKEIWNPGRSTEQAEQKLARMLLEENKPGGRSEGNESALNDKSLLLSDGAKFAKVLNGWLRPNSPVWNQVRNGPDCRGSGCSPAADCRADWDQIRDGVRIGKKSEKKFLFLMLGMEKWSRYRCSSPEKKVELLNSILKSWVRMLIFVSTRCSRDSHAKQLGRGCELTTIVWILYEHAGIFGDLGRKGKHS
jgi:hypothetical protein